MTRTSSRISRARALRGVAPACLAVGLLACNSIMHNDEGVFDPSAGGGGAPGQAGSAGNGANPGSAGANGGSIDAGAGAGGGVIGVDATVDGVSSEGGSFDVGRDERAPFDGAVIDRPADDARSDTFRTDSPLIVGVDASSVCMPRATDACYDGLLSTVNVGACRAGTRACRDDGTWGPCLGQVLPASEDCATAADDNCDGARNENCPLPFSCRELPSGSESGPYTLDADRNPSTPGVPTYCNLETNGGGWALVFNSAGSQQGLTNKFWQIPYADRLKVLGDADPARNFYAGILYQYGREYFDEVVDLPGKSAQLLSASATGFDTVKMKFLGPTCTGDTSSCANHFLAGWSSTDFDGDTGATGNCALLYGNVTQHYASCWVYNLGADSDTPREDAGWGPHVLSTLLDRLALYQDATQYSRVMFIRRWTRWPVN